MTVTTAIEAARQDEVLRMLRLGDQFALGLYPPEGCFLLDVSELEAPGTEVFVARDACASAAGMVALVDRGDGTGEIKRMFVLETARGSGVARALLLRLEDRAGELGIRLLQLETGTEHAAALALYPSAGYRRVPRFGPYINSEFSVCMQKVI